MEECAARLADALLSSPGWRASRWMHRSSGYEPELCDGVNGLRVVHTNGRIGTRYHDAEFGGAPIEIKKGSSIIVNLVRCAEQVACVSEEAAAPSLTLCIRTGARKGVREFVIVDSHDLAAHALGTNSAETILNIRTLSAARDVQCQAFLSWPELRKMALQRGTF